MVFWDVLGQDFLPLFFFWGVFTWCKLEGNLGDFEEIFRDHHLMETSGAEVKMDFRLLLDLMWSDPYGVSQDRHSPKLE